MRTGSSVRSLLSWTNLSSGRHEARERAGCSFHGCGRLREYAAHARSGRRAVVSGAASQRPFAGRSERLAKYLSEPPSPTPDASRLPPMWERRRRTRLGMSTISGAASTGRGVIVIFDRVRDAPIAHVPECRHVTEDGIALRMIEMEGKAGRCWWLQRLSTTGDSSASPTPTARSAPGDAPDACS